MLCIYCYAFTHHPIYNSLNHQGIVQDPTTSIKSKPCLESGSIKCSAHPLLSMTNGPITSCKTKSLACCYAPLTLTGQILSVLFYFSILNTVYSYVTNSTRASIQGANCQYLLIANFYLWAFTHLIKCLGVTYCIIFSKVPFWLRFVHIYLNVITWYLTLVIFQTYCTIFTAPGSANAIEEDPAGTSARWILNHGLSSKATKKHVATLISLNRLVTPQSMAYLATTVCETPYIFKDPCWLQCWSTSLSSYSISWNLCPGRVNTTASVSNSSTTSLLICWRTLQVPQKNGLTILLHGGISKSSFYILIHIYWYIKVWCSLMPAAAWPLSWMHLLCLINCSKLCKLLVKLLLLLLLLPNLQLEWCE